MLRVAFRCGADLDKAYCQVNNQLVEDLPDDRFLTAFMGFLDPANHSVRFHSGGQGPILHYQYETGTCHWLKPTSFPVGIMEMEEAGPAGHLELAPGDILALLSDGIYEYANRQGMHFGEEGVERVFASHHLLPMKELGKHLLKQAIHHGGGAGQADDITLVLIRRLPAQVDQS